MTPRHHGHTAYRGPPSAPLLRSSIVRTDLSALAERERFDAVILDKQLPGPNGLDLLSFLRKRLPAVPVIFVTAFGGPGVAMEAARRGAYSYLEKPFRIATVLDTLAAISMHHFEGQPGPQV